LSFKNGIGELTRNNGMSPRDCASRFFVLQVKFNPIRHNLAKIISLRRLVGNPDSLLTSEAIHCLAHMFHSMAEFSWF
jgi:hypothetical protein